MIKIRSTLKFNKRKIERLTQMKNVNNKEKMQEFFDKRADSYDKHMQDNVTNFTDFYKKIAEPIKKTKTKIKVLDLGCGTGLELEYIFQKAPNARVTGIDLSEKMLEKLKAKYQHKIEQITLIRETYLEKELKENHYDYIISVMSFHHLIYEKKKDLYLKIYNSLKDKGKYIEGDYIVSLEKEKRLLREFKENIKQDEKAKEGLYHIDIPFSLKTQKKLLAEVGFNELNEIFSEDESAIYEVKK